MATVDDDYYQSLLDAGNASLDEYNKNQEQLANAAPPPAAPESLADKMVQAFKSFVGAGSSGAGVGEFKESEAGRNWQVSGLPDADPFYGHDQANLPYQDPNIADNSQQSVQNIKDTLGQYVDAAVTDLQRVREANQNAAANSTNPDLTALPDADPFYAHDQSGQPYMDPNIRTPEQEQAANQAYRDIVGTAAENLAITPGVPAPVRGVAGLLYAPVLAQDMVNTYNQNAAQQSQSGQDNPYAALGQTAEQTLVDPVLGPIKQALTHPIDYVQSIMDNPTRLWSEAFLPGTVIGKPMQKIQAWADRNLTADDMVDAYNQDHSSSNNSQPDMQLAQPAQAQPGTVDAWIQEASQTYGVPENLIRSVIDAESSFNPEAGSSAGAYGYMQLMPETAESLGVDRTDPRQNILGGTKYLREQLDSFGGNVENALAAYNAGPEAVREAGGVPDYPETQAYVAKIMNNLGNEKIDPGPLNEAPHSQDDSSNAISNDPLSSDVQPFDSSTSTDDANQDQPYQLPGNYAQPGDLSMQFDDAQNPNQNIVSLYRGEQGNLEDGRHLSKEQSVYDIIGKQDPNAKNASLANVAYYTESPEVAGRYANVDQNIYEGLKGKLGSGYFDNESNWIPYTDKDYMESFKTIFGHEPRLSGEVVPYDVNVGKVLDLTDLGENPSYKQMETKILNTAGIKSTTIKDTSHPDWDLIDNRLHLSDMFGDNEEVPTYALLKNNPRESINRADEFIKFAQEHGYDSIKYAEDGTNHYAVINKKISKPSQSSSTEYPRTSVRPSAQPDGLSMHLDPTNIAADDMTKEAYLQASHKAAMDGDYQTAYDLAIKAGRPDWAREWRRLSDYGDLDYSKTSSSKADLPNAQDIVDQFNQDQPNPSSERVLRTPGVDPNAEPNPADIQPKTGINAVADKFLQSLSPESRDDMARFAAESIRNHRAELDHACDTAFADLKPLSQDFARQANQALGVLRDMTQGQIDQMVEDIQQGRTTKDPNLKPVYDTLDFINRMENGQKQLSRSKQALADAVRYELDSRVQTIQGFGNGKLQQAIQNYFPHIWDKGDNLWRQLNSKRPLLGTQSFTKKRSIDSTLQGIKLGFLPKTLDPAEMTLMKAREMDRYIAGQRSMNDLAQKGWRQYHSVFDHDIPQGWVKVNDRAGTVYGPPHVVVKEAYDAQIMDTLNQVAADLGVTHERSTTLGRGMAAGTWGVSEPFGQKIMTRFGGPESVLAHEIGHQMDAKYDMQEIFLHPNDPALKKTIRGELKNLAALRDDPPEAPDKKFSAYLQKPSEQMATIVQAYVHAPELIKKTAPNTYSLLQEFLAAHDELHPLQNIQRSLQLGENETTQGIGGMMVRGHYYVPESAGRVLDNYLNPGLRGNAIYDTLATASNTLNAAQLALSAYHAGFTTLEATASKASLGVEKLSQGNIAGGVKDLSIAATPGLAAGLNIRRGAKLYAAWFDPQKYPEMQPIVKAMEMAGGRATMDPVYSLRQAKSIREAFQANGLVGVAKNAYRIPGAIMEGLSYPIMEWLVPRQKLGVFADLAANELKRNPDMTLEQMRHVMARVWDSVDNRLGQIVYDNKFISRTAKDAAFLGMRSVGWNYGTWAELGGAPVDLLTAQSRMGRGENLVSHKMAYAIAMPATVALYGAIAQYVMTGQGPQEWKDYFYPRTGQFDVNGRPQRVSLPSYIKDLYHLWNAPGQTVLDKLNPLWSIAADLYKNRDFYGTRIENQDDPWYMRRAQDVEYLAKSMQPFGIRNAMQNKSLGGSLANQALPFVGITSAPGGINMTAAEQKMEEYLSQNIPTGTRTQEQNDARDLKRSIMRDVQQGNYDSLSNALSSGQISPKQAREYTSEGKMPPLVRGFAYLRPDQAIQVYNAGSAEEKQLLRKSLGTKLKNFNAQASPEEKAQMQTLIKTIQY